MEMNNFKIWNLNNSNISHDISTKQTPISCFFQDLSNDTKYMTLWPLWRCIFASWWNVRAISFARFDFFSLWANWWTASVNPEPEQCAFYTVRIAISLMLKFVFFLIIISTWQAGNENFCFSPWFYPSWWESWINMEKSNHMKSQSCGLHIFHPCFQGGFFFGGGWHDHALYGSGVCVLVKLIMYIVVWKVQNPAP